jgi:hypothetical protein
MDVSDYNCVNVADRYGGRGVTLWGPVSAYLAPNGGTVTWAFTGTHPKCYQSRDNCNFTYTIHTTQTSAQNDVGPIACELNKYTNPPRLRSMGNRYHSRIAGRDLTETIDLVQEQYQSTTMPSLIRSHSQTMTPLWVFT